VTTFKNGGMDKVIPDLDLDNIVLETDSPYLAPVPHRGKRNEPSFIPLIAERICELKKVTFEELATLTTLNSQRLFEPASSIH
jgi:TatD DNase family protein